METPSAADHTPVDELVFALLDALSDADETMQASIRESVSTLSNANLSLVIKAIFSFLQVRRTSVEHQLSLLNLIRQVLEQRPVPFGPTEPLSVEGSREAERALQVRGRGTGREEREDREEDEGGDEEEEDDEESSWDETGRDSLSPSLARAAASFMVTEIVHISDRDGNGKNSRRGALSQIIVCLAGLHPDITLPVVVRALEAPVSVLTGGGTSGGAASTSATQQASAKISALLETVRETAACHPLSVFRHARLLLAQLRSLASFLPMREPAARCLSSVSEAVGHSCLEVARARGETAGEGEGIEGILSNGRKREGKDDAAGLLFALTPSPHSCSLAPSLLPQEEMKEPFLSILDGWAQCKTTAQKVYSLECLGHLSAAISAELLSENAEKLLKLFGGFCGQKETAGSAVPLPVLRGLAILLQSLSRVRRDAAAAQLQSLLTTLFRILTGAVNGAGDDGATPGYSARCRMEVQRSFETLLACLPADTIKFVIGRMRSKGVDERLAALDVCRRSIELGGMRMAPFRFQILSEAAGLLVQWERERALDLATALAVLELLPPLSAARLLKAEKGDEAPTTFLGAAALLLSGGSTTSGVGGLRALPPPQPVSAPSEDSSAPGGADGLKAKQGSGKESGSGDASGASDDLLWPLFGPAERVLAHLLQTLPCTQKQRQREREEREAARAHGGAGYPFRRAAPTGPSSRQVREAAAFFLTRELAVTSPETLWRPVLRALLQPEMSSAAPSLCRSLVVMIRHLVGRYGAMRVRAALSLFCPEEEGQTKTSEQKAGGSVSTTALALPSMAAAAAAASGHITGGGAEADSRRVPSSSDVLARLVVYAHDPWAIGGGKDPAAIAEALCVLAPLIHPSREVKAAWMMPRQQKGGKRGSTCGRQEEQQEALKEGCAGEEESRSQPAFEGIFDSEGPRSGRGRVDSGSGGDAVEEDGSEESEGSGDEQEDDGQVDLYEFASGSTRSRRRTLACRVRDELFRFLVACDDDSFCYRVIEKLQDVLRKFHLEPSKSPFPDPPPESFKAAVLSSLGVCLRALKNPLKASPVLSSLFASGEFLVNASARVACAGGVGFASAAHFETVLRSVKEALQGEQSSRKTNMFISVVVGKSVSELESEGLRYSLVLALGYCACFGSQSLAAPKKVLQEKSEAEGGTQRVEVLSIVDRGSQGKGGTSREGGSSATGGAAEGTDASAQAEEPADAAEKEKDFTSILKVLHAGLSAGPSISGGCLQALAEGGVDGKVGEEKGDPPSGVLSERRLSIILAASQRLQDRIAQPLLAAFETEKEPAVREAALRAVYLLATATEELLTGSVQSKSTQAHRGSVKAGMVSGRNSLTSRGSVRRSLRGHSLLLVSRRSAVQMTRELWDDEGLLAMAGRRLGLGSFRDALLRQCVPFLLKKADTDPPSLFSLTMSPNDGDLLGSSSEASGATGNSREKEKTGEGGDKAEGVGLESLMMSQQQQAITLTDTAAGGGLGESSAEALSTVAALLRLPPDLTDDLFRLLLANLVKILQAAVPANARGVPAGSSEEPTKGVKRADGPQSAFLRGTLEAVLAGCAPSVRRCVSRVDAVFQGLLLHADSPAAAAGSSTASSPFPPSAAWRPLRVILCALLRGVAARTHSPFLRWLCVKNAAAVLAWKSLCRGGVEALARNQEQCPSPTPKHKKNVGMITSRPQQQKGRVSSSVPVSPMASSSTRPAISALSPSIEHHTMAAEGLIPPRPFGSDISVSPLPLEGDDVRAGEGVFSDAVLESLPDWCECAGLLVPRMADPHPDVAAAAVGAAHDLLAAFPPTAAAAASMRAPQQAHTLKAEMTGAGHRSPLLASVSVPGPVDSGVSPAGVRADGAPAGTLMGVRPWRTFAEVACRDLPAAATPLLLQQLSMAVTDLQSEGAAAAMEALCVVLQESRLPFSPSASSLLMATLLKTLEGSRERDSARSGDAKASGGGGGKSPMPLGGGAMQMQQQGGHSGDERVKAQTLACVRVVARACFPAVVSEVLDRGPSFSPARAAVLEMLARDRKVLMKMIQHLTDVLNNTHPGTSKSPNALVQSATAALAHLLTIEDSSIETVVSRFFPQLFATFLLRLASTTANTNAEEAVRGAEQGLEALLEAARDGGMCASFAGLRAAKRERGGRGVAAGRPRGEREEPIIGKDRERQGEGAMTVDPLDEAEIASIFFRHRPEGSAAFLNFVDPFADREVRGQRVAAAAVMRASISFIPLLLETSLPAFTRSEESVMGNTAASFGEEGGALFLVQRAVKRLVSFGGDKEARVRRHALYGLTTVLSGSGRGEALLVSQVSGVGGRLGKGAQEETESSTEGGKDTKGVGPSGVLNRAVNCMNCRNPIADVLSAEGKGKIQESRGLVDAVFERLRRGLADSDCESVRAALMGVSAAARSGSPLATVEVENSGECVGVEGEREEEESAFGDTEKGQVGGARLQRVFELVRWEGLLFSSVPDVAELLDHPDDGVRCQALEVLGDLLFSHGVCKAEVEAVLGTHEESLRLTKEMNTNDESEGGKGGKATQGGDVEEEGKSRHAGENGAVIKERGNEKRTPSDDRSPEGCANEIAAVRKPAEVDLDIWRQSGAELGSLEVLWAQTQEALLPRLMVRTLDGDAHVRASAGGLLSLFLSELCQPISPRVPALLVSWTKCLDPSVGGEVEGGGGDQTGQAVRDAADCWSELLSDPDFFGKERAVDVFATAVARRALRAEAAEAHIPAALRSAERWRQLRALSDKDLVVRSLAVNARADSLSLLLMCARVLTGLARYLHPSVQSLFAFSDAETERMEAGGGATTATGRHPGGTAAVGDHLGEDLGTPFGSRVGMWLEGGEQVGPGGFGPLLSVLASVETEDGAEGGETGSRKAQGRRETREGGRPQTLSQTQMAAVEEADRAESLLDVGVRAAVVVSVSFLHAVFSQPSCQAVLARAYSLADHEALSAGELGDGKYSPMHPERGGRGATRSHPHQAKGSSTRTAEGQALPLLTGGISPAGVAVLSSSLSLSSGSSAHFLLQSGSTAAPTGRGHTRGAQDPGSSEEGEGGGPAAPQTTEPPSKASGETPNASPAPVKTANGKLYSPKRKKKTSWVDRVLALETRDVEGTRSSSPGGGKKKEKDRAAKKLAKANEITETVEELAVLEFEAAVGGICRCLLASLRLGMGDSQSAQKTVLREKGLAAHVARLLGYLYVLAPWAWE